MSSSPPPPKTIILTFDGTDNEFCDTNTNVIRLFSLLQRGEPWKQVVYYQPGIGTYLAKGSGYSPMIKWYLKQLDRCFGWYLDAHILDGYRFLMRNYRVGDKVCLFGFSRGAYTARCLAGMLNKVGLLINYNDQQIEFAYKRYLDTSEGGDDRAEKFKSHFSVDCEIQFLGVWDTVSSIGLHRPHLPYTSENNAVKILRQALALDERRVKYKPDLWSVVPEASGEQAFPARGEAVTNVLEVWFPGNHSDIGGGYDTDESPGNTANTSLVWMLNQILLTQVPIFFDEDAVERCRAWLVAYRRMESRMDRLVKFRPVYDRFTTRIPVTSPLHNEFRGAWAFPWWVMEFLSFRWFPVRPIDGRLGFRWKGLRQRRIIPYEQIFLHSSVHDRAETILEGHNYAVNVDTIPHPTFTFVDDLENSGPLVE